MSFNEKLSYTEFVVETPTTDFNIGFSFTENIDKLGLLIDDVDATEAGYTYRLKNSMTLEVTPPIASGIVRIYRETNLDSTRHVFKAAAKFVAANMDTNFTQLLHSQQEVRDQTNAFYDRIDIQINDFTALVSDVQGEFQAVRDQVDAAEATANAANNTSQDALDVANTIASTAQDAFDTAERAETTANGIAGTADNALNIANAANGTANEALDVANDALAQTALQPATTTTLGGIKVGTGLAVTPDGTLSSEVTPNATEVVAGKAKIATTAIAQEGEDDTAFLTAKKLRDALNASGDEPIFALRGIVHVSVTGTVEHSKGVIESVTRLDTGMYEIAIENTLGLDVYPLVSPLFYDYGLDPVSVTCGVANSHTLLVIIRSTYSGSPIDLPFILGVHF